MEYIESSYVCFFVVTILAYFLSPIKQLSPTGKFKEFYISSCLWRFKAKEPTLVTVLLAEFPGNRVSHGGIAFNPRNSTWEYYQM